jgi:voltage-gated potassium channel
VIAETSAAGTELVGCTLADLDLRQRFGISVVGLWDRGELHSAAPHMRIEESSILLLVGRREQVHAYDDAYSEGEAVGGNGAEGPVVVLGGGRVGRAVYRNLVAAGHACRVVEKQAARVRHLPQEDVVLGDAADLEVLREAGIDDATAVVVTTHDDDTNVYLTLYARKLRPRAEILGRVELDLNITTMHRAGADFVLSYATMGAIEAWNELRGDSTLLLAEGLVLFRVPVPSSLAGRTLRASGIPTATGVTVIGVVRGSEGASDPQPDDPLPAGGELLLIGDDEAEERFFARYVNQAPRGWLRGWLARLPHRD